MKRILLFSFAFVVVYGLSPEDAANLKSKIMKIGKDCMVETTANPDDVTEIMQKKIPSRKEGKCLLFCVHKKVGFQDAAGKMNIPGIDTWIEYLKTLDEELSGKMRQIVDKCTPTVDDSGDECETAGIIFDCYMKTAEEMDVPMLVR